MTSRPRLFVITASLLLAACSSDTSSTSDSTPVPVSVDDTTSETTASTEPTTTEAPAETDPPSTEATPTEPQSTEAPEPTAAPAPETTAAPDPGAVLPVLLSDAIGPLLLGATTPEEADAYLSGAAGAAVSVETQEYPDALDGYYENSVEETGFAFQYGRSACYPNGLCVYFGGSDPTLLTLVGYRQDVGAGSFETVSGVTAGSTGVEFPAITSEPGGCFSTGGGSVDDVQLFLQSNGVLFTEFDQATETYTNAAPPPEDLVVISVFGGEEPFFLFEDC